MCPRHFCPLLLVHMDFKKVVLNKVLPVSGYLLEIDDFSTVAQLFNAVMTRYPATPKKKEKGTVLEQMST